MIRGFLTGAVLGGVVAVGGLATISVLTHNPTPEAEVPQVAPAVAETAPAAPATPSPETPVAEVQPQADTAPQSPAAPDAPAAPGADTQVAALDTPAAPPATGAASTAPAAPALPEEAAPVPETAAADPGVEAPRTAPSVPDTPAAEPAPSAAEAPPLPPLTPEEEALLKQLGDGTGDLPPEPAPGPAPEPTPEPAPQPDPAPEVTPTPPAEEPVAEEPASTLVPAPGLKSTVDGVRTNQLPRIGDAPAADAPAAEDTRPLVQYAQAFDNQTQKPLYAIILVDNGAADLDRAALAALSFPVTFALDPLDPNTPDHAAIYRAAGQEVVMLATGIPDGAQASDLEVAFGVMGEGLPEAVAVLDIESGAFQKDRVLSTQVVPLIADQGRGLVTWDRGLNAADQVARREGLPAAVVFRSLDAEGETTPIIRRYLDRAAFKAAQEGRVVVVGSTRPETVAALIEWAIEGRSSTVALAPVTAVLTTN